MVHFGVIGVLLAESLEDLNGLGPHLCTQVQPAKENLDRTICWKQNGGPLSSLCRLSPLSTASQRPGVIYQFSDDVIVLASGIVLGTPFGVPEDLIGLTDPLEAVRIRFGWMLANFPGVGSLDLRLSCFRRYPKHRVQITCAHLPT
jgi:hypothetical protein